MKRRTTRYIVCALLCSVVSSPLTAQKAVRIEQPSYTFDRAQQMYREGNYAGCIDLMTQFREQATRTTDKAKADYLIAVSAYAAKEPDALDRIENYLFCHPKRRIPGKLNFYGDISTSTKECTTKPSEYMKPSTSIN